MKFIVKFFPEITVKSGPVRKRMARQLKENLRILLRKVDRSARVSASWDKLEISVEGEDPRIATAVAEVLGCVPGIANFARVRTYSVETLEDIYQHTFNAWQGRLEGKTFCVRVKRNGKHPFRSIDVERYVGGGLCQHTATGGVKLVNPDETVALEVRDSTLYLIDRFYPGLGGYPIGSQGAVLSLISGGFDSTVASYQTMRRGLRTHFLFFNLGGRDHELGVKEIAYYLWSRYAASHRVKFITVPFEGVVAEILEHVDPSCMGVILKRQMLRAAEAVAERADIPALVTGEAVAQVSSQTLDNLSVIDETIQKLVLRPLALMDKGAIIDICRAIGAEELAAAMPEYCGVISVRPSASVRRAKVEEQEAAMPGQALASALARAQVQIIDELANELTHGARKAAEVREHADGATVIDIRHPNEQSLAPLALDGASVLAIPFYTLSNRFASLAESQHYLLYCEKGVMSQLHANHLLDAGFTNVGVYRPRG